MRAVVVDEPGGPDAMVWREVPDPEPGPGEVLLDVAAFGVNRADLLQRQGRYPPPPGAPAYLGLECSGRVTAVGPDVSGWPVGAEGCALMAGGCYAERVAVPAGQLMPIPAGVDLVAAAALPEAACTVWSNVFMMAGLRPDEVLLVHGGAGGIGTMAIQLGRAVGATVAATARSAERLARCGELGATILVDHVRQDFVAEVRASTGGRGADVVLDPIGAKYLGRNVDVLAPAGRLVVIGLQGGRRGELDLAALMERRAAVLAALLRPRPVQEKTAICAAVVTYVWPLIADGTVGPVIDRVLPFADVAQAHQAMESGEVIGKVVLAR